MSLNEFELHPDRLGTTDAKGKRLFLYPADVKGFFRTQRTRVELVLIAVFLLLPWLRIDGQQALLLNIAERRFELFGLSLRAHNAPLLIFVFAAAAFGLFFATSLLGRVWCGWGCPQTVFIDRVFRPIERFIEGAALERRKLNQAPWTAEKIRKRSVKWILYIIATLVITHSFLAYFIGTDRLAQMVTRPPSENWGNFLLMFIASAVILFDFAWFREQFCTIICPYGRLQSVLMDANSMIVAYDEGRGEPRATPQAKVLAKAHNGKLGDCVNCYRCVQVCPTGIDIRRGVQLECIACTACIDACDDVMTKLKKPTGLIRYDSLRGLKSASEKTSKMKFRFSPRAATYLALCLISIFSLAFALSSIDPVSVEVFRAKGAPYTTQSQTDGVVFVVNHLKLELSNQSGHTQKLNFSLPQELMSQNAQLVTAVQPVTLQDGLVSQIDVFVRFPKALLSNGQLTTSIFIKDASATNKTDIKKEVTLVGPF